MNATQRRGAKKETQVSLCQDVLKCVAGHTLKERYSSMKSEAPLSLRLYPCSISSAPSLSSSETRQKFFLHFL